MAKPTGKQQKRIKKINALKKESRKYSVKDGIFSTIKFSLGDSYIVPFAIAINASNSMIALFSSIPGLLGPISQWFSSRLIEKYKRKDIVSKAIFFEILMWLPLITLAFLFHKGIVTSFIPLLLLIFFTFYIIIANIAHPAWFSWIGDLVDEKNRGKWFGKRTFIFSLVTLIFTILAAISLDFFRKNNYTMFGFITLFSLAMIARIISGHYLKKQYEPKLKLKKGYYFSFSQFIKKASKNNFGKFAIYRSLMWFAASISGPFFAVYMLKNLHFSYTTYIIVVLSQTLFSLLMIRAWGKFADKYGNYEVLKITGILVPLYPILWLISESPIFLILGPQLIGGIAWGGFNLAAGNFIFDSVTPQKRGLAVSYFNLLNGIGIFLGATLGALLVKYLPITFIDIILFIFLISAFARMIVSLIMLPRFREIRETKPFESSKALRHLIPINFKIPIIGASQELVIKKISHWKK